jgi:hypothetical protein
VPPSVVLGPLRPGGIAPSVFVLVERGAARRPELAAATHGEAVLSFAEGYPPVAILFGGDEIVVGEEPTDDPDVTIAGSLPLISGLLVTPMFGGVPRTRGALTAFARGEIRITGKRSLARRLLALIALDPTR